MILSLCAILAFAPAPVPAQPSGDFFDDLLPVGALIRLGSLRDLPANAQTPVAVMPDGKTIVTGERRGLRFVNVESGKQTDFFPIRCQRVLAIALTPDGKRIAATIAHDDVRRDGSIAQSIYLCDLAAKKVLWNRGGVGYSYPQAGFADDGRILVIQRIDWERGKRVEVFHCDTEKGSDSRVRAKFRCFAISPDGKKIAYGASDWTVQIQDANGWVLQDRQFEQRSIDRLAWSSDGRLLAIAGRKIASADNKSAPPIRRLAVMDGTIGKVLFDSPLAAEVEALAFSPDARILGISAGDGDISSLHFRESASGKELWPALDRSWRLPIPLPLADGARITIERTASGHVHVGAYGSKARELWGWWTDERLGPAHVVAIGGRKTVLSGLPFAVFDIESGKGRADSGGHRQAIRDLRFSPAGADAGDGSRLISIDEGNYVRAWQPSDRKNPRSESAPRNERGAAQFLRDGTLVFVGFDGSIRVRQGANERSFAVEGLVPSRSAFEVTPSGLLAAQTTAGLELWDLPQGKRLATVKKESRDGRAVRFSADERFLLADSSDGQARLFAVSRAPAGLVCLRADLNLAFATARFAPNSKWLVGLENAKLRAVDLTDGKNIAFSGNVRDFAFSSADSTIAVRRSDRTHRLLLIPSRRELSSLRRGDAADTFWDGASACTIAFPKSDSDEKTVFSADGRLFAVTGESAALYESATGRLIGQLPDGHPDGVSALAFSPDGKKLATGGREGTILIWDWPAACGLIAKQPLPLESMWNALADADANKAYSAIIAMANAPQETTAFLRQTLAPAKGFADMRALVEQLDADSYRQREAASKALRLIGAEAEPFLRSALSKPTSAEAEKRIDDLLADSRMEAVGVEIIRTLRAIHLLELIGTVEAKALLRDLARGDPQRIVTRAAGMNAKSARPLDK